MAIEAEALKRYRKMTILDHLTQLFNRRYFSATLEQECERATRIRQTLSLLMVDIDHFKRFNDTYGHAAGDCVLALVGKTIRNSARIMDQAVRYGGEEFAVMLPHTPRNDAYQVADRLRQTISSTPCHGPDGTNLGNITVSIGVASFPVDAQTPDGLVHAADRALYRAKGNGRNIVCNDTADLRREARYAVNLKAELLTNHGPNIANEGLILDISHCGAKCATSAPIQPKDELELRLSKELLTTPLPVQVRWVHPLSDQYSHIGLLFKATPPQLANFLTEQFKAREA